MKLTSAVLALLLCALPLQAFWECGWDEKPQGPDYSEQGLDRTFLAESSPLSLCALFAIRMYQETLSGYMGVYCNFYPSCSRYGLHALAQHGLIRGWMMTGDRISRCHAYSYLGSYERDYDLRLLLDPVPADENDYGFFENLTDF